MARRYRSYLPRRSALTHSFTPVGISSAAPTVKRSDAVSSFGTNPSAVVKGTVPVSAPAATSNTTARRSFDESSGHAGPRSAAICAAV